MAFTGQLGITTSQLSQIVPGKGAITVVGFDTFTETVNTVLGSHTPDRGVVWALEAVQFTVIAATDFLQHNRNFIDRARKGDDLGSDNMDISASVSVAGATARIAGVCARMSTDNFTNQYEAYLQFKTTTTQDVFLFKNVAGVRTQLGTAVVTLNQNVQATLKLSIRVGTQEVFLNGVSRIATTEPDATLSGREYAGIIINGNNSSNALLDTFLSESVAVAALPSGVNPANLDTTGLATVNFVGTAIFNSALNAPGVSVPTFTSGLIVSSIFNAPGAATVLFVGLSTSAGVGADFNFSGGSIGAFVSGLRAASMLGSTSVGTVLFDGITAVRVSGDVSSVGISDALWVGRVVLGGVLNAPGVATTDFRGENAALSAVEVDWHSVGVASVVFNSGGVLAGSVLNVGGQAYVLFRGENVGIPTEEPGNLYVPIRYVVGMIPNVVPVETVFESVIGVVPCRVFVGPDNVVPVREVIGEVPRVKVRIV